MNQKDNSKAVSSVISELIAVILILLLAIMVGTTVFNIYQEESTTPSSQVSFEQSGTIRTGYSVTVTVEQKSKAERIILEQPPGNPTTVLNSLGEKTKIKNLQPGDTIQVISVYEGKRRVTQLYTVKKTELH